MPVETLTRHFRYLCRLIMAACILSTCGMHVLHAQAAWCCAVSAHPGTTSYDGLLIGPGTAHYPYNAYNTYTVYWCNCSSPTSQTVTATGEAAWGQWCGGGCEVFNNASPITCPGQFGATSSTSSSWTVMITPYTAGSATDYCESGSGPNGIVKCSRPFLSVMGCVQGASYPSTYYAQQSCSSSMNLANKNDVLAALNTDGTLDEISGATLHHYHCSVVEKVRHPSPSTSSTRWECSPDASTAPMTISSVGYREPVLGNLGATE
jgi:hypothetical protein